MKNLGNEIFKKLYKDEKLSPEIFKQRMALALVFYNKAMKLAKSPQEKSSIQKNIAMTQLLIAKKFIKRKRHLLVSRLRSAKKIEEAAAETKEINFYLEESMETFDEAVESGELAQPLKWMAHVTGKQEECADLLWDFLLSSDDRNNLKVLFGKLHQLCLTKIGAVRARLFLKLGRFTFQMAIAFQEKGKVVESLQLLRDNNFNIEEAKKLEAQMEEALELEDSTYLHICIGESAKFRQIGDKLWEEATLEEEDINMELVWDAVDNYVQSIVSSRGKCIESEAISHSHLGRLYEILILNAKSREHFRSAIDLGLSMHPKTFNDQKWYKQAVAGLDKFQKQEQYKENKEKERIRGKVSPLCKLLFQMCIANKLFEFFLQPPFARSLRTN